MKKNLLNSLLLTLMVLVGGSAWAGDWNTVWTTDFSSAPQGMTYSVSNGSVDISTGVLFYHQGGGSGNRAINTAFTDAAFNVDTNWQMEFDWGGSSANKNASNVAFATNSGTAFTITWESYATTVTITDANSTELTSTLPIDGYNKTTMTNLSHFVITGDTEKGIYLTVTNGETKYVDNALVSSTFGYPATFNGALGRAASHMALDNIVFKTPAVAGFVAAPTATLTGVNGASRIFTLASLTAGATIKWSETAPVNEEDYSSWTVYDGSATTAVDPIYAVATDGTYFSQVSTIETGAGAAVTLNAPVISVTGVEASEDFYTPILTATVDESNVLLSPTATIAATFNGTEITFPFIPTEDGTLIVTATADGYQSASAELTIKAKYVQSWVSTDYSTLTDENATTILGENWAKIEGTGRWSSWKSDKEPYTYYQVTSDGVINVKVEENLQVRSVVQLNMGYGLSRNVSGGEAVNFLNTENGTIAVVKYYTGYGAEVSESNTSLAYLLNKGNGMPTFSCNNAKVLMQVTYYNPYVPPFDPSTAITNADFSESTPIDNHLCGYGKDMAGNNTTYYGLQDITGWNKVVVNGDNATEGYPNSGMGGAVFAYGSEWLMKGNQKAAPAADPNGEAGNALGFFGVWGCGGYYYQDVTLPAGKYTLFIPIYNQSGTQANESYTGFFVNDEVKYTVAVNTTVGAWVTQSVEFELTEETAGQIRLGYKSTGAGSGANPMIFIDGVTIMTELDGAITAYNIALAAANTAAANEVVTGEEKTTLNEAIAANSNIDMTSVEAVKAATSALTKAVEDFNAAKASYETLAAAKALVKLEAWPYAAAAKKTAVEEAVAVVATSAEDATAKTTALQKAYRLFVESNALAEGVEGAAICTDSIKNPAFDEGDAGWTVTNMAKTSNEPWTDSQDNSTHNYMDKWNGSSMNISVAQDVTLTAGKYVLTAIARATEGLNLILFAGEATDTLIATGNAGNVFNRGWNDVFVVFEQPSDGTINIGMKATINNQWASFSNFRLAQLEKYEAPEPVKTDYTEYIVNADLKGEGGFDATETKGFDGSGIVKVSSGKVIDFKQTIENLPAGKYKVTAQAAYRYSGNETDEAAAIAAGTETKFAKLYATVGTTTVDTLVLNRWDGASDTDYANGDGSVTVNEKFVPNSSSAVQAWFNAGQYVNEVVFNLPADGAVTIGIVKTAQPEASDYVVIGPWTLTRLGDADAEPEPEPEVQPGQDMTKYITNPSFETGNTNGWTYETSNDHGAKRNDNGTYTMTNCDGDYLFNIWSSGNAISQKVENLPNGTYLMKAVIATDANQQVQLNANGKSIKIDAVGKETGVEGELEFDVLNNTATIGAEGVNKYWYKVDNFRLTYVKGFDIAALKDIYKTALAEAQAITGNMSAEAKLALTAAIAVEVDTTDASSLITAANTLTEAATTANASVAAYAKAKAAIDAAKAEMAATNVYTTEALEAYKAVYDAAEPKYENGTMTDEEAKALENPTTITGWHDATIVDNFLLSAWDTNPDFQDAPYYINTWSTEGNNDGSNFKVPFFEYWTSDANSLGAKTLTATMNSLPAGDYDVTAWVRVRIKNGAEAPATGITLQANDGEAVNVAAGEQVGTSQMYLKEFTATGTVTENGELKIKFNVAAENNISWLSFKNVKFEKKPFKPEAIEGALYSWESPEGLPGEYGGKISYENGVDNRLNYQNSGYYTICLNGKKANMNDTIASANASYMLVTLDEALSEGDTIYITAYVNKNASKKASAYILFDNGADVESPVYSDEANIDTLFNGVPTTKSIIVTEAMAGAKSFKMTRGQTGTNLFITKFVIMKKKSEPVEPAKYEYNGYVTIARIAQNNVLGDVTSETQKVTITETEDKAIVAVTFSGFETFPEFTFNANVTGGDSVTYTVAEGSKVNVQQGQMAIEYNLTGNGTQASTEAIPTIALQMSQNPAMTINVVFAATAEEAKAALLKTTGIINIARDAQKNVIYNINGQKVNKAQKGLFIINGKKVVNK